MDHLKIELQIARTAKALCIKSGNIDLYAYWLREVVRIEMLIQQTSHPSQVDSKPIA